MLQSDYSHAAPFKMLVSVRSSLPCIFIGVRRTDLLFIGLVFVRSSLLGVQIELTKMLFQLGKQYCICNIPKDLKLIEEISVGKKRHIPVSRSLKNSKLSKKK